VTLQIEVLWVVTLCSFVLGYQRIREAAWTSEPLYCTTYYTASQPRRPRLECIKL